MDRLQEMRFSYADIAKRFRGSVLSDFDEQTSVAAKEFIDGDGWRSLIMLGNVGTGKTHLAAALAKEFSKNGNAIYTTAMSMSERVMEDRSAHFFNKHGLLIIDEITRTYETKAERNRFFDIINYRYENLMPVIIIGNTDLKGVIDSIGPALADRLKENISMITLTGKSKRF